MGRIIFYRKHTLFVNTTFSYRRKSLLYPLCIPLWNIFFHFTHKWDVEFHLYEFLCWIFILYVIMTGSIIREKGVIGRFFHFIWIFHTWCSKKRWTDFSAKKNHWSGRVVECFVSIDSRTKKRQFVISDRNYEKINVGCM